MKRVKFFAFIFILSAALVGCAPDLVVKNLDVTWNAVDKKASAEIANIGNKDAGTFMVYFNGDEDPVSPNYRPQVRYNIPGLAKGAAITLDADFAPLAHPDNDYLRNVYKITVLVDPKGMVKESNENNNVKEVLLPRIACINFGPPPPAGTLYGSPAGNVPGDVVMVAPNGIEMFVYDFRWMGGGGTFNLARIEMPPVPFGTGQTINTNNINLEFDFSGVGFPVSRVELQYLDLGGFENLGVNGQPVPIYAGELSAAPSPIAGVNVSVTSTPVPGGKTGTLVLTGAVQKLRIGGQEFWIDNVCAKE
ncbi:MAG: CARDB domain-containing protein [Nitrospirota bacterium]|nr:CARDB domain-containing protein [Nitrospirota bacterium]